MLNLAGYAFDVGVSDRLIFSMGKSLLGLLIRLEELEEDFDRPSTSTAIFSLKSNLRNLRKTLKMLIIASLFVLERLTKISENPEVILETLNPGSSEFRLKITCHY